MPDAKVGGSPSITDLVTRARDVFDLQLAGQPNRATLRAAFNNAIVELVVMLEEACDALRDTAIDNVEGRRLASVYRDDLERCRMDLVVVRNELAAVQNLSKRHSFSATDPVCVRCIALVDEVGGNVAMLRLAVEGDACSKCGAVVCVRRTNETDAQFRARLRDPSNRRT